MRSHERRTICTCSNATVMSVYHPAAEPSSAPQASTHPARVPARGIPDRACALLRSDPRARQSQGSATQTRVTAWRVVWARVGVLFGVRACMPGCNRVRAPLTRAVLPALGSKWIAPLLDLRDGSESDTGQRDTHTSQCLVNSVRTQTRAFAAYVPRIPCARTGFT